MKHLIIIFTLFINQFSFAGDCDNRVTKVDKGGLAPCSGYLFSPELERELRIKDATYDQMEALVKKNEELNSILYERVDNLQELNLKLNDKIQASGTQDFYEKFLFFGLGVIVTGFIAANVR